MLIYIVMRSAYADSFIEEIYTTKAQAERHIELSATVNDSDSPFPSSLSIEEHELNDVIPNVYFRATNQGNETQGKVIAAKLPKSFRSDSARLIQAYGVTQAEADSNLKKLTQERS